MNAYNQRFFVASTSSLGSYLWNCFGSFLKRRRFSSLSREVHSHLSVWCILKDTCREWTVERNFCR